ncbi:nucleotidyl transferase AbiEii/AbiGii toxin family protein [Halolactibacillus sp. JCM 19043]|uniref:nucleotidyl transferase AbiEii/AbiGii toxin family protein n=1 Tax=Halolactibacillus sp. JCM 19043 TaxID=1460638 RepID=UPI000784268C|nr:nucleotidyl transferase AbiEii/AbiGii toxin family protein [Halolactibacillus sp. JCM 19043]
MNLHHNEEIFEELIQLTAKQYNLPSNAVRKDYFITRILSHLQNSPYVNQVVFKGGTSLSKCYPGSIERFSEDIDLTYIPEDDMSNKQVSKQLKAIERVLVESGNVEKIGAERNDRNKSSYVWFTDEHKEIERIKLEIGSSVRPHPYSIRQLQSYIQDFLEHMDESEAIEEFQLEKLRINVLSIERTFVDKILSVKRHAMCGTLHEKVRHIYDVVKLSEMKEVKSFLEDKENLKNIIQITKQNRCYLFRKKKHRQRV